MSTDRSVEIIKEICPTWEIFDVKNTLGVDISGIQHFEQKYDGWKMALNISEYLIIDDLQSYIKKLEQEGLIGVRSTGVILVDRPDNFSLHQFNQIDLITKKDYGYLEQGKAWSGNIEDISETTDFVFRSRLLHRNYHGRYHAGRHQTELDVEIDPNLYVAWFGRGSPELYRHRCKEWSNPPNTFTLWGETGRCFPWYEDKYIEFWKSENKKSVDIFEQIPNYKKYLDHLYQPKLSEQ